MGARDEVLRPAQVRKVADTIPGDAGFRLYPDGWHWLFRDLQAARVWQDVGDFVLGRLTAARFLRNWRSGDFSNRIPPEAVI